MLFCKIQKMIHPRIVLRFPGTVHRKSIDRSSQLGRGLSGNHLQHLGLVDHFLNKPIAAYKIQAAAFETSPDRRILRSHKETLYTGS